MAVIELLADSESDAWDKFVLGHNQGSIYHTSQWQRIIGTTYGLHPLYIVLKGEGRDILGGLPLFCVKNIFGSKSITSLPCAQSCNPLFDKQADYDEALRYIRYLSNYYGCRYAELRTTAGGELVTTSYTKVTQKYSTYILDLGRPLDVIKRSFHKSCVQRPIEKAYRSGLELIEGRTEEDLRKFYSLYVGMRKDHGLLPQPFSFFHTMWKELKKSGHMDVFLAKFSGKVISSILLLKFKQKVTYEYGASMPGALGVKPSHFLIWEAIKRSAMSGYKMFDFGRTSDDDIGLSQFKSRWGTKREALIYYLIHDKARALPARESSFARKLMQVVVGKSPDWLCRRAGEILYKYLV